MSEVWFDIKEFKGYQVSTKGNVRRVKYFTYYSNVDKEEITEIYYKPIAKYWNGLYLMCELWKEGKRYKFYIHRIMVDNIYNRGIVNSCNKYRVKFIDGDYSHLDMNNFRIIQVKSHFSTRSRVQKVADIG